MNKISDLECTLEDYMVAYDMKILSRKTLKYYNQSLKLLIKYLQENHKIDDIKKSHTKD